MSRRLALAALVALVAAGCGSEARVAEPGSTSKGRELFVEKCGACHVLGDARTQGVIGPNLDDAFDDIRERDGFGESTIRDVVRGQIAYPVEEPPTGEPGMPANIVTGDDADAVATYVAAVAGLPVQDGGGDGGGDVGTDGQAIFTQFCASCHTLAAAGAAGAVGPSLDASQPDRALVVDRVTNGKGAMPSFADQLDEAQIQAVADYVAENAGG